MRGGVGIRDRWRSLDRRVIDAVIADVMFGFMTVELVAKEVVAGENASNALAFILAGAIALPLAWHRRHPMAALAMATWATVVYALGHFNAFPGYALFFLLFGISLHSDRRRAATALGAVVAAMSVALWLQPATVVSPSTWVATLLAVAVAWLSGENLRAHRAREAALRDRAERLEREREERARQAVNEERLRIARELHDVVAHAMSVIAVQAGVANHVIDSRPEQARQALATVETNTRSALVEMRRLLGVLRPGDERSASLTPAPGLAEVPTLVRQLGEAGLAVDLHTDGLPPGGVPDGVDLSAYRIVQEGLTNVLRHGGPRARVTIGRQRLPAQGHPTGRPAGRNPGGGRRRRVAVAQRHPAADRGLRAPAGGQPAGSAVTGGADRT